MTKASNKRINVSIVISIISLFVSILLTFVFNKFLLDQPQIGDVNYGLKSTVDSLTSFISIFVLGMSSTFIRFHRKYEDRENDLFSSFNIIILVISGFVVLFGTVLVVLSANNVLLNPEQGMYTQKQVHDFVVILTISLLFLLLSLLLSCNKWYLESIKSIVFVRVVNLCCVVFYPLISIIFVLNGADMIGVTIIYSAVYLCGFGAYLIYRLIKTKGANPFVVHKVKKEIIKEILVFSFFVVVASFVETFNHSVDKIILTIGFGAAYTTLYQLSMSINQVLLSLCDTLYAPYVPYLSDEAKNNDIAATQKTYDKVSFVLLLLCFSLIVGFFACGKDFVILWLGEERVSVYYFALVIFLAWPVYGIAKFSLQIHRAYNAHYRSTLLFLASFGVHLIVTFSLVWSVGVWACVVGTSVSMLFLGVTFLVYNKKRLCLQQKSTVTNIVRFCVAAAATCALSFLLNALIDKNLVTSHFFLLVLKGLVAIFVWAILLAIVFHAKAKSFVKRTFCDDFDSDGRLIRMCLFSRFKGRIRRKKQTINSCFSFVMIGYFLLNFASYYLGGITPIHSVVSSSAFGYGTKAISYLLIAFYFVLFFIANECSIQRTGSALVLLVFLGSVVSAFIGPKFLTVQTINKYDFLVEYQYFAGFLDVSIGVLNFAIDLFVMLFFVFYLRKGVEYKQARVFLLFVVFFGVAECLASFFLNYQDYLALFSNSGGTGSGFDGYSTNISGTFSSKNGFGFLLFGSFVASSFELFYRRKKAFLISSVLLFVVSGLSLCKTSFISICISSLFFLVAWLIRIKKKNKRTFVAALICIITLLCFAGFLFTPLARQMPFIGTIAEKIKSLFITSGEATTKSRSIIWAQSLKLLVGPFVIFGYGKDVALDMLLLATNMTTLSFHNALLSTLCSYGVIGLVVWGFGIAFVVKNGILSTNNLSLIVALVGVMASSLLYGMMEVATLFMSSSSVLIASNVILALHYRDKRGDLYEEIII